MRAFTTLLLALFYCTAAAEETERYPVLTSSDTRSITNKVGQRITVRGTVSDVRKSNGGTHFINFENGDFYLVVFKSDLETFKDIKPADHYPGKHLAVTGVISLYKNKPQMKLLRPDMVKIISKDDPIPTSAKKVKSNQTSRKKTVRIPGKKDPEIKKKKPPVDPKKYFK